MIKTIELIRYTDPSAALSEAEKAVRFNTLDSDSFGCLRQPGKLPYSVENLDGADRYYQKTDQSLFHEVTIGTRGKVYLLHGNYANAVREYKRALEIARQFNDTHEEIKKLNDLTEGYCRENDVSAAEQANREARLNATRPKRNLMSSLNFYAYKLAAMKLHAKLLMLSAGHSAGSRPIPGVGLVGLSWALLRAGAQNVIAGLWSVQAKSTATMMSALYERLKKGVNPSRALHSAKLDLNKGIPQYLAPYYRVAFQIYSR